MITTRKKKCNWLRDPSADVPRGKPLPKLHGQKEGPIRDMILPTTTVYPAPKLLEGIASFAPVLYTMLKIAPTTVNGTAYIALT